MKKKWIWVLLIVIVVTGLIFLVIKFTQNQQVVYGKTITFRGHFTCLEHKQKGQIQTAECRSGITTGSKTYETGSSNYLETYAEEHPAFDTDSFGDYEVSGVLQKPNNYIYANDGIIQITNLKPIN